MFVAITVRTVKFHVSQPGELINSRESVALKLLILFGSSVMVAVGSRVLSNGLISGVSGRVVEGRGGGGGRDEDADGSVSQSRHF